MKKRHKHKLTKEEWLELARKVNELERIYDELYQIANDFPKTRISILHAQRRHLYKMREQFESLYQQQYLWNEEDRVDFDIFGIH